MTDTILILANSFKNRQWCVAEKSTTTHQWVRLVSDHAGAALSTLQTTYTNSYGPQRLRPLKKIIMEIGASDLNKSAQKFPCNPWIAASSRQRLCAGPTSPVCRRS